MSHNSPVRRSFEPEEGVVGNLSELSLSLFDRSNPDEPSLLGQLDLAPEISRVYFIGEGPSRHPVRFRGSNDLFYGWWYDRNQDISPAQLQVLPVGADVDLANPIAVVDVPARADLRVDGDQIYVIHDQQFYEEGEDGSWETRRQLELSVIDFTDPTNPVTHDSVDLSEILSGYQLYFNYHYDYWGCFEMGYYWWGRPQLEVHTIEGGLAIKTLEAQEESLGQYETCSIGGYDDEGYLDQHYLDGIPRCDELDWDERQGVTCQDIQGYSRCGRFENSDFTCHGGLRHCLITAGEDEWSRDCEPLDEIDYTAIAARQSRRGSCHSYEKTRHWGSLHLNIIEAHDSGELELVGSINAPTHERFEGLIIQEGELYYSYSVPVNVDGDEISYVRHFTRSVSLESMSNPSFNAPVNLPGKLLLKHGDQLVSRDQIWGVEGVISTINFTRLNEEETRARFEGMHSFEGRQIQKLIYDEDSQGEARLYVSHSLNYRYWDHWAHEEYAELDAEDDPRLNRISIFDLSEQSLLGEAASDRWSNLVTVRNGRGVFNVGGGVLMMDLSDPEQISAQGFFPIRGWSPHFTVEGDEIFAAAGRFGVYKLPLNSSNLLPPL